MCKEKLIDIWFAVALGVVGAYLALKYFDVWSYS